MKKVKKNSDSPSISKGSVAKLLAAVGAVGLGASLYLKREKVRQVVNKLLEKVKKSA